jgi:hypothetical protein
MSDLRQNIVDANLTRFAQITVANGYKTNIGLVVREWQTTPLDETERTAILVHDPIDLVQPDPNGPNSSKRTWALQIVVDAVLQEAAQNAVEARKAISDIFKAIGVDPSWGGLARRSEEVSARILRDKSGANVTGAQVVYKVLTSRKPFEY